MIGAAEHSRLMTTKLRGHLESCHSCCLLQNIAGENQLSGELGAEGMRTRRKCAGGAGDTEEQGKTSVCKNMCVVHQLISTILHLCVHFKVSFLYDISHI